MSAALAYPNRLLDSWRIRGDPSADAVIAELVRDGRIPALRAVLRKLASAQRPRSDELPRVVTEWLQETAGLPESADVGRLERGLSLISDHAPQVALALGAAALPYCYACYPDVKVLTFSRRLERDHHRRIGNTAQFILALGRPRSLRSGGEGIRRIQNLRLLHAAVRHLVAHNPRWDAGAWGTPINQEALVGTLLSLSVVVARSIGSLGVPLGCREARDYVYAWGVVGEMLGIAPDVLPRDDDEAMLLTEVIALRHHRHSEDGAALMRALLALMASPLPQRFDATPAALVRHLSGDTVSDLLGVPSPESRYLGRLAMPVGRAIGVAQSAPILSRATTGLWTMLVNRNEIILPPRRPAPRRASPSGQPPPSGAEVA